MGRRASAGARARSIPGAASDHRVLQRISDASRMTVLFRCGCFLVLAVALLVLLARAARTRIVAADLGAIAPDRLCLGACALALAGSTCTGTLGSPTGATGALALRRHRALRRVLRGGLVVGLVGDAV